LHYHSNSQAEKANAVINLFCLLFRHLRDLVVERSDVKRFANEILVGESVGDTMLLEMAAPVFRTLYVPATCLQLTRNAIDASSA